MPVALPSEVSKESALSSALLNRRIAVRYPGVRTTSTRLARRGGVLFRGARVQDLSQGGIALVVGRPVKVGEDLCLHLKNRLLGFSFDLAAQVRHVRKVRRGRWVIGLAFARELSLAELACLL